MADAHACAARPCAPRARADSPPPSGKRRRIRLAAFVLASLLVAVGAWLVKEHYRQAERAAQVRAQVAGLFKARLGVDGLCHLGRVPFATPASLTETEALLRRLAPREEALTLACGLSVLARSHALIGRYPRADRLADEANCLLKKNGLQNLAVAATTVSLLNLQAHYAPAEKIAKTELHHSLQEENIHEDSAATRLDALRLQIELSRAQWGLADDEGAMSSLEDALARARALAPPNAALLAEMLTQRGEWRGRRFDFAGAEGDLNQAIAMSEDTAQADNARYHLVRMLSYSEQPARAVAQAERLIADRSKRLGGQHPDTGRAWIALSDAQYGAGRIDDSVRALQRGKAIVLASYGPHHPEYAEVLRLESLHDYLHNQYQRSVGKAREAVRIDERIFGPTHEQTLRLRVNLATKLVFGVDSSWDSPNYREGLHILEDLVQTGSETDNPMPYEKMLLGIALAERAPDQELPRAERILREVRSDVRRYLPARAAGRYYVDFTLTSVMYRRGHQALADASFARFVQTLDDGSPLPVPLRALAHEALMYRALYAMSTCRRDEALAALRHALKNNREHMPAGFPYASQAQDYLDEIQRNGMLSERFGRKRIEDKKMDAIEAKLYFEASSRSLDCARPDGQALIAQASPDGPPARTARRPRSK